MPEPANPPAKPADPRDRRVYVWWGVGLGLLLVMGLVCLLVVRPALETRRVIMGFRNSDYGTAEAIRRLGGSDAALRKLSFYLRLPDRVAPQRDWAAILLGSDERALVPLTRALRDGNAGVREGAAVALGRLGSEAKSALPELVLLMEEADGGYGEGLSGAIDSIGSGTSREVPGLARLLSHRSRYVRYEAARQLGLIGPPASEAAPELIRALSDPDSGVRGGAAESLGLIGPGAHQASQALEKALWDHDVVVRVEAAAALWRITGKPGLAVSTLVRELKADSAGSIQEEILAHLGEMGMHAAAAVPLLKERLASQAGGEKRVALALCLCRVAGPQGEGFEALLAALNGGHSVDDRGKYPCEAAARALGELGLRARAAAPALNNRLADPDPMTRIVVAEALWRTTGQTDEPVRALIGVFGVPDEDCYLRRNAADVLGRMGPAAKDAVQALIGLIEGRRNLDIDADESDEMRAAAEALGEIGPPACPAAPSLSRLLQSPHPFVRRAAAQALKKIRGEEPPK